MKTVLSIFALTLGLALTVPAFAGDVSSAKTQADCQKAGGVWNADTGTCEAKEYRLDNS
jgi:ABC-type nickel/cobalt efflux system permease component RcnA